MSDGCLSSYQHVKVNLGNKAVQKVLRSRTREDGRQRKVTELPAVEGEEEDEEEEEEEKEKKKKTAK